MAQAVTAHRAALQVNQQTTSSNFSYRWGNLGNALRALGELTEDAKTLRDAEGALIKSFALENRAKDPLRWETIQNNLALAQRWLGAVTGDAAKLQEAAGGYAACENLRFAGDSPFTWATLQWNIADLALARYRLDDDPAFLVEARDYVARARAFFVVGSDYQTERCDELMAQIDAAATGS